MKFSIFVGDIADAPADAVCTSTNPRLSLMMGTGASIRARGGPSILLSCQDVPPLPPGAVHVTPAGSLPHKIAIHCVASDASHHSSEAIVRACVTNALTAADAASCTSIAMPVFGTGHARLRFRDAVRVMAQTLLAADTRVREVTFVTNDEDRVDDLRTLLLPAIGIRVEVMRSQKLDSELDGFWSNDYGLRFDEWT